MAQINIFIIKNIIAAIKPLTGMVSIHAHSRLTVTPHLTADNRLVAPTPMMDPVMVCVVLTGILKCSVINNVMAPADSAATHSSGVTLVMRVPIVFTIFHPPLSVPKAMATKHDIGTQSGIDFMSGI